MKKKLIAIALVSMLGLTACGNSESSKNEKSEKTAAETTTQAETEEETTEEETTTLTYNGKDYIVNKEAFEKWLAENGKLA